jgi:hypothetical protein
MDSIGTDINDITFVYILHLAAFLHYGLLLLLLLLLYKNNFTGGTSEQFNETLIDISSAKTKTVP